MLAAIITTVSAGVLTAAIIGGVRVIIKVGKDRELAQLTHDEAQRKRDEAIDHRIDALVDCQQAFGHDRIIAECKRHLDNGWITTIDLDNMMHLMRGYEGVGGNGTAHLLWEAVKRLPIDDSNEPESVWGKYPDEIREEIQRFHKGVA